MHPIKMEESVGLGNHVRHDAITGASEPLDSKNPFKCSEDYVTSFVAASFPDQDEVHQRNNGGLDGREIVAPPPVNAKAMNSELAHQPQPQQTPPAFPVPPPHPNHWPRTTTSIGDQHQSISPSLASNAQFPSNPPAPPMHQTIVQSSLPIAPPLLHLNFSPPPGLPPQFPPPTVVPPGFDPTSTSGKISAVSLHQEVVSARLMPSPTNIPHDNEHSCSHETTQQNVSSQSEKPEIKEDETNPVEKARLIARRFHIENTQRMTADSSIPLDVNYLQKRRAHFQKEQVKLEKFRLKNLEYVIKRDEIELAQHVNRMNQITAYEEKQIIQLELAKQQQREQQLKLEQRQQQRAQASMMNATCGGLGSKDQQRTERVRKREHLEQGTSRVSRSDEVTSRVPKRNSLYLTNLPTDGSTTEGVLNTLFSSYGRLDRVTMYRHRSTGELKGDGLIVFGRDALDTYGESGTDGDLIDVVCMQMNGAELPCGTIIGVQPADMNYKQKSHTKYRPCKQSKQDNDLLDSTNVHDSDEKHANNTKDKGIDTQNENEELDDFFASL